MSFYTMLRYLAYGSVASLLAETALSKTVVGNVPTELNIHNGVASFSVPISTPEGRGGFQPELSLEYSSAAGPGFLGMGWSLGGLSEISRCGQTLAQDGKHTGIGYDNNDRFCLDGQRLVSVGGGNDTTGTNFRTEVDTYSRITRPSADSAQWEVRTKAGLVLTYAVHHESTNSSERAISWRLVQVNDSTGNNTARYHYLPTDSSRPQSKHLIRRIDYPGASVRFSYEQQTATSKYINGNKLILDKRLSDISVYRNNLRLHRYKLSYSDANDSPYSYLRQIQMCDRYENCMNPIDLQWQGFGEANFGGLVQSTPSEVGNYGGPGWDFAGLYDVNGDSLRDSVWVYSGTDASTNGVRVAVSLAQHQESQETDDDARYAQFRDAIEDTGTPLTHANHNGSPFGPMVFSNPASSGGFANAGWSFAGMHDTDADGLNDAVWVFTAPKGTDAGVRVAVSRSLGNGRFANLVWNAPTKQGNYGADGWQFTGFHDTNADGFADAVWVFSGTGQSVGVRVAVSLGQGNGRFGALVFNNPKQDGIYGSEEWQFGGMHDVNGDSRADALWVKTGKSGSGALIMSSLAEGNGRYGSLLWNKPADQGFATNIGWAFAGFHDVDGDGFDDGVWQYSSGSSAQNGTRIAVSRGIGNGRFAAIQVSKPSEIGAFGENGWRFHGMQDVNDDDLPDGIWIFKSATLGSRIVVAPNKGNGHFDPAIHNETSANGGFDANSWQFAGFHDTNGDRLPDAVWTYSSVNNNNGVRVVISRGEGNARFARIQNFAPFESGNYGAGNWEFAGMHDATGDALPDALWIFSGTNGNGARVTLSRALGTPTKISQISDSYGNTTQFIYKYLTNPAVYEMGQGAQFPELDVTLPISVVAEVRTSNGIGDFNHQQFHYAGLRMHAQGRGFYGYKTITEYFPETQKMLTQSYDQRAFPLSGQPTKLVERIGGDLVQVTLRKNRAEKTYSGRINQLITYQVDTAYYELGESEPYRSEITLHHELDHFGNIGRTVVHNTDTSNSERYTRYVDREYSNNTSDWFIGRVTQTTSTFRGPSGVDQVRRSIFSYDPVTGLLTDEQVVNIYGEGLANTHYERDQYGQVTVITEEADGEPARQTTYAYNGWGQQTRVCNSYSHCKTNVYNPIGQLTSSNDANDLTIRYEYDGFGRLTYQRAPDGQEVRIERHFAADGQCSPLGAFERQAHTCLVTKKTGQGTSYVQFDRFDREVRRIKQGFSGPVFQDRRYNAQGQLVALERERYRGDTAYWATTRYDRMGRVIRLNEPGPNGIFSTITTQHNGLETTVLKGANTDSITRRTVTRYNAIGKPTRVDQAPDTGDHTFTEYTYNSDGSLATTRVAGIDDSLITLEYDDFGRKVATNDPNMGRWTYEYNGFDEMISQTDAKGQVSFMAYDQLGRLTSRTEEEGISEWVYGDSAAPRGSVGKLLLATGTGMSNGFSYDELGRQVSTTKAIGSEGSFTTATHYDALSRVARIDYPGNTLFFTENHYDENGYLVAVTGSREQAESHSYATLMPLVREAVELAEVYREQARELRALANEYSIAQPRLQLDQHLQTHQNLLNAKVEQSEDLSPEFMDHLNNTLTELEAVTTLLNRQSQYYLYLSTQLTILAEQTLLAADRSFQIADTLAQSADIYEDFQAEANTDTITYWKLADMDAEGRVSAEVYGNGIVNDYAYNPATGQLESIHSSLLVFDPVRHLEYQYDVHQNVTLRHDLKNDIRETYEYDHLDRLRATTVSSGMYVHSSELNNTQILRYDALGNITYKSDIGDYSYGAYGAGINAVTLAGTYVYEYDANGNMTNGAGRTIEWSSFNKATFISKAHEANIDSNSQLAWSRFEYGVDRARYKKVNHKGDVTLYAGRYYEKTTRANGEINQKHTIYAGGKAVAEHIVSSTEGIQTRYLHTDALGSVDLITDAYANVVDRRSFDSWGKLRKFPWKDNATLDDPFYLTQLPYTNKGYTGHESVQEVVLIHMNGRMYDASLARFISADPFIQAPYNSQSYSRYSYVINNPMKYNDPSGYIFEALGNALSDLASSASNAISSVASSVGNALSSVASAANNAFSNAKNAVHDLFSNAKNAFGNVMSKITNAMGDAVKNVVNSVSNTVSNAINFIASAGLGTTRSTQTTPPRRNEEEVREHIDDQIASGYGTEGAPVELTEADLAILIEPVREKAQYGLKEGISREDVLGQSDTLLIERQYNEVYFEVEGHNDVGSVVGSDLNYIGVGAVYNDIGDHKLRMKGEVFGWNFMQALNNIEGSERQRHNLRQATKVQHWAELGYDYARSTPR